jgi:hypothetical protein
MTISDRPPAFRLPSPKNEPLFVFFGKGDYVIARTAVEASCLWMDHFDDLCCAREFEPLPADEAIDVFVMDGLYGVEVAAKDRLGYIETALPGYWIGKFGPGYLASTTED